VEVVAEAQFPRDVLWRSKAISVTVRRTTSQCPSFLIPLLTGLHVDFLSTLLSMTLRNGCPNVSVRGCFI
jgi:hypothetical protein